MKSVLKEYFPSYLFFIFFKAFLSIFYSLIVEISPKLMIGSKDEWI